MDPVDTAKFTFSYNQSTVKVTTPSGIRLQLEAYTVLDGIIVNGPHFLRLRRASHASQDHKVTLKLAASDFITMRIVRTLIFDRGTIILNLKISKEDVLLLVGPKRDVKLLGELTVEQWKRSAIEPHPTRSTIVNVSKIEPDLVYAFNNNDDCCEDSGKDEVKWYQELKITVDCYTI